MPTPRPRTLWHDILGATAATTALLGLPLLGVVATGRPISDYTEFPPLTRHVAHAPFSPPAFALMAAAIAAVVLPLVVRVVRADATMPAHRPPPLRFPWWGWAGVVLGLGAWIMAWTRFTWFASLQCFTFSPLWFAYIVVVNALTFQRSGRCMLTHRPRDLATLFVASAAFWWYFEYLNRFVQNWYYVGCEGFTPPQYIVFATLPFSTVLPAVLGTEELLATWPRLTAGLDSFTPFGFRHPRRAAVLGLVVAALGLALIGVFPSYLYPLLWLSPLLVLTSLDAFAGRPTVFDPIRRGDGARLVRLALGALICGFFWEMWNVYSLAKWRYSVPFVQALHLFEMPLLGYAGYLPFGLECAAIADRFMYPAMRSNGIEAGS